MNGPLVPACIVLLIRADIQLSCPLLGTYAGSVWWTVKLIFSDIVSSSVLFLADTHFHFDHCVAAAYGFLPTTSCSFSKHFFQHLLWPSCRECSGGKIHMISASTAENPAPSIEINKDLSEEANIRWWLRDEQESGERTKRVFGKRKITWTETWIPGVKRYSIWLDGRGCGRSS